MADRAAFMMAGCESESPTENETSTEMSVLDTPADDSAWSLVTSEYGADPAGNLGGAHSESDTVHRVVYKTPSDAATMGGSYDPGTIFLKELRADNGGT